MKAGIIAKLDLRTDEQKQLAKAKAEAKALDKMWDWKVPPRCSW